jgi:hypothetical protein
MSTSPLFPSGAFEKFFNIVVLTLRPVFHEQLPNAYVEC